MTELTLERQAGLLDKYGHMGVMDTLVMLDAAKAELARIAEDKAYLAQAHSANEWEERYKILTERAEKAEALAHDTRDVAAEMQQQIYSLQEQIATLTRELEAERSGVAAMREALHKCKQREWLSTSDIDAILSSSTAGAEMLTELQTLRTLENNSALMERLRKAEDRIAQMPVQFVALGEDRWRQQEQRIATLEAALANDKAQLDRIARAVYPQKTWEFTYSVDFIIKEIAALKLAEDQVKRLEVALEEAQHSQEVTQVCAEAWTKRAKDARAALEEERKALERVTDAAKSYRSDILGLSSDRDYRDPRNWQLWGYLHHTPQWPARDESIAIAEAAHEHIGKALKP